MHEHVRRRRSGRRASPATCCTRRPNRSTPTSRSRTATRRCRPRRCTRAASARARCGSSSSPLVRFVRFYVLRLGFLDGVPGFAHIAIGCFASFMQVREAARAGDARIAAMSAPAIDATRAVSSVTGARAVHRHARRASACSRADATVIGVDNLDPVLRRRAEGGAPRAARCATPRSGSSALDLADARRPRGSFATARFTRRRASRRAAGRALFARQSRGATSRNNLDGVRPRARRLPARAASSISSTRRARASTARTTRCRSPRTSRSTIRSASTRRPRRRTS